MIRPNLGWRMAVVLATASLALTACGNSDSSDKSSSKSSSDKSSGAAKSGDGTLTIGTLLPQTGDLAFLGPPEIAGVDLAVKEINDAGGVNGQADRAGHGRLRRRHARHRGRHRRQAARQERPT